MTPEERSILQSFLADLSRTPNVTKDPEAEAMIADAVRANPDAAYLLVQHAILADPDARTPGPARPAGPAPSSSCSLSPSLQQPPRPSTAAGVAPADAPAMAPVWGPRGGTLGGGSGDRALRRRARPMPDLLWRAMGRAGRRANPVESVRRQQRPRQGASLRGAGQMAVGVAAGDFLFQGIENIFSPRW